MLHCLKTKRAFCFSLAKAFISLIVLIVVLFANMNYYSYYNKDGYFQNDNLVFFAEAVKSIDVNEEKALIASGSNGGIFHKEVLSFTIRTDTNAINIDSGQFYGYKKIYEFLSANKNVVTVRTEDFSELIDYENKRIFKRDEAEYINRIMSEFA